jgi:hypothetical protein
MFHEWLDNKGALQIGAEPGVTHDHPAVLGVTSSVSLCFGLN